MPDAKFDLGDYVEVKDRIKLFYELYGQGRLVTEWAEIWEHGGKVRVVVKASAYRTPDDNHPATGYSWMEVPGTTPYTRGSELENTETSAWGRAIAALGILVDRSIASGNEVRAKATERVEGHDGLIGTAVKQKARTTDFSLRETADGGAHIGFRLTQGAGAGVICEARDDLARALVLLESDLIGQRLQVWGQYVEYGPEQGVQHPYRAYRVSRIQTPSGTIPAETDEPANPDAAGGNVRESTPQTPVDSADLEAFKRANPNLELLPETAA